MVGMPGYDILTPIGGGLLLCIGLTFWLKQRLANKPCWDDRRQDHLLVLFLPVLIGSLVSWHLFQDMEVMGHPPWEASWWACPPLLGLVLSLGLCLFGMTSYLLRHSYLGYLLWNCSREDSEVSQVQVLVNEMAQRAGVTPPRVRRLLSTKPRAVVVGLFKPVLYLSSWYFNHFPLTALQPVLAHELAHIARQDNLIAVWASGLLSGSFWSPASWQSFQALLRERELAADELAARYTGEPLKLARVLLKVSEADLIGTPLPASSFEEYTDLEARVERLIELHQAGSLAGTPSMATDKLNFFSFLQVWLLIGVAFLATNVLPHWLQLP
ncbi:M56 family metallopeptidase [Candidatus Cyanaurora vandensis]|uniref:M56 family metallopeptidase n=1 Tax=Candidatus Cyanaurora vandensis TaxID=2714958 RepID=UPI0025798298|nr:M56 family metallopeptidase [Candidatus Cyanaurora vandensis]